MHAGLAGLDCTAVRGCYCFWPVQYTYSTPDFGLGLHVYVQCLQVQPKTCLKLRKKSRLTIYYRGTFPNCRENLAGKSLEVLYAKPQDRDLQTNDFLNCCEDDVLAMTIYIWSSGESRIFLEGGALTPKVGVLTCFLLRKLHEYERIWTGGGRHASLAPPIWSSLRLWLLWVIKAYS